MTLDERTQAEIKDAARILRAGGLVALPTETVYGLGARADDADAVAKIFTAKNRPALNPLICHMSSLEMAENYVAFSPLAKKLARKFWPGALTLVLPKISETVAPNVSAGLDTLAVRVPSHPIFEGVIAALGVPIAAPSANRSGRLSPTTAAHVRNDLGGVIDAILDGGPTRFGLESTVVFVQNDEAILLRHGAIARETLETFIGAPLHEQSKSETPISPGQLLRHYAPRTALVLNSSPENLNENELWIGFGDGSTYDLSPKRDLHEAAHNLFARLAELDLIAKNNSVIHIAKIPNEGIGEAINDRLSRAAQSVETK